MPVEGGENPWPLALIDSPVLRTASAGFPPEK